MFSKEQTRSLITDAQKGNSKAKEKLIENNSGLVHAVLKRYKNIGYEYDDLYQIGCIGLLKAVKGFDMSRDTAFSTYAVLMIAGEIKRHLRDDGKIKVSRSIKELGFKCEKERVRLEQKYNKQPTITEIAERVNCSVEEVSVAICAYSPVISLDTPASNDSDTDLFSLIGVDDSEQTIEKIALREAIGKLENNERKLIYLRYFKGQTQSQAADNLGMTQVQVSRREKNYG